MLSFKTAIFEAKEKGQKPWELLSNLFHMDQNDLIERFQMPEDSLWEYLLHFASSFLFKYGISEKKPIKSIGNAIELIGNAKNVIVLLGAGASTGPDFRSPGGLYDTIAKDHVLDDPSDVFDYQFYLNHPEVFWSYAHKIFPKFVPFYSETHCFIERLEQHGKLLRLYSQNVDTLEKGIPFDKLKCVHGSWRHNYCSNCRSLYFLEDLRIYVEEKSIPKCKLCGSIINPGIVFFGQPTNFNESETYLDGLNADLLLVIGTSLKVSPISELPLLMPNVPSLLINRSKVDCLFNGELLGECDDIVSIIQKELDWIDYSGSCSDFTFFPPNSFVLPSDSPLGTHIAKTSRSKILVSSSSCNISDLL